MHAVDTNVVIRYLTLDDAEQSLIARAFVDGRQILVLSTVLVECEWVLRSVHRLSPSAIQTLLLEFAGLPTVTLEQPALAARALDWFAQGMDFADALHLAGAEECEAFATFDRKLVAAAKKAGAGKVKAL